MAPIKKKVLSYACNRPEDYHLTRMTIITWTECRKNVFLKMCDIHTPLKLAIIAFMALCTRRQL